MGELVANNGTYIVNNTTQVEGKLFDAIIVLEDTIFLEIFIGEPDVLSEYIANPAIAIKAGARITPMNDLKFTSLTLVSGSVELVLA